MKVKVLKEFRDKNTGKIRKVDSTFTCNKERLEEILKVGDFVEELKANKKN